MGPGAALVALGLAALMDSSGVATAGGVGIPLGIVLAWRGYRMGAETRGSSVTVRGLLRTRVISRAAITGITDFPAIVWTDPVGNKHWSPVLAFQTPPVTLSGIAEHHAACLRRLRQWARHR
jgi:hypothetical protein